MSARQTADRQLVRLLGFLPHAARRDGIRLAELAKLMNVPEKEILRDLTEVLNRAFYQPAGSVEDVQVGIEAERIRVWTTGEFQRPLRLTRREAIALGLALRVVAAAHQDEGAERLLALAQKFDGIRLTEPSSKEVSHFALFPEAIPAGAVQEVIAQAVRQRQRCRIEYLKTGAAEPGEREIDPYALIGSKGRWYTIGHCHASSEIRIFRLDRVLTATPLPTTFELPDGFDPESYVEDARVFRAEEAAEVMVRYRAEIARWIREQGHTEELPDGRRTGAISRRRPGVAGPPRPQPWPGSGSHRSPGVPGGGAESSRKGACPALSRPLLLHSPVAPSARCAHRSGRTWAGVRSITHRASVIPGAAIADGPKISILID